VNEKPGLLRRWRDYGPWVLTAVAFWLVLATIVLGIYLIVQALT